MALPLGCLAARITSFKVRMSSCFNDEVHSQKTELHQKNSQHMSRQIFFSSFGFDLRTISVDDLEGKSLPQTGNKIPTWPRK